MGIVPRQRRVATAWTALLVVGAVLVLFDLARVVFLDLARSNRPSDRRCAEPESTSAGFVVAGGGPVDRLR
jgi:hypothetical protein